MLSKTEIKKPSVYIATNLHNMTATQSALDVAEAIEYSPFIDKIFAVEGIYDLFSLSVGTDSMYQHLAGICETELALADLFIMDMRNGDPAELGYAVANGKPFILYNPEEKDISPVAYGKAQLEVYTLDKLADVNFLNILLKHEK